jgi:glycosyltransferase involved in cell wall biosynthesis
MKRVLVLTNSINGLYSFRREMIQRLVEEGHEVVIAAPPDDKTTFFTQLGCICIETLINRRGTNPIKDLNLLLNYLKILKEIKPNVVLTYTIKPNVYGGIACRIQRVPYISNITGLGTSIENKGFVQKISLGLYKLGLKNAECVFFQNENNKLYFTDNNIVKGKVRLIPGSGVNLVQHSFEEYPEDNGTVRLLFIGRIMKAKGIDELLIAASKVKEKYPQVKFDIVGACEEAYTEKLIEYEKNRIIIQYGRQNDVHSYIKNSHAIINPSHHEGMSNVLLESASTGRPILASNIPGCKEAFDNGISGLGFEAKNSESIFNTIAEFIKMPYKKKIEMGLAGRRKMEKEFNRDFVINAYFDEIEKIISKEN